MGRTTRREMIEKMGIPPLRVWQMSQQALSGMVAGLLTQPKFKGRVSLGAIMNSEENPKALKKRIAELEKQVMMQERLISILREMPGCKQVKLPQEKTPVNQQEKKSATKKQRKIPEAARNESGSLAQSETESVAKEIVGTAPSRSKNST